MTASLEAVLLLKKVKAATAACCLTRSHTSETLAPTLLRGLISIQRLCVWYTFLGSKVAAWTEGLLCSLHVFLSGASPCATSLRGEPPRKQRAYIWPYPKRSLEPLLIPTVCMLDGLRSSVAGCLGERLSARRHASKVFPGLG